MRSSVLEIVMQAPSSAKLVGQKILSDRLRGLTSRQIRQKLLVRTSLQRLRGNLKKLEDLGLIHSIADPTHRLRLIYFPGKGPGDKPQPIDNSQVIRAVIASAPEGINFRSLLAKCHLGISPPQMVWELRNLMESGAIVCKSDPKHKRRFLYFLVNNDAINS